MKEYGRVLGVDLGTKSLGLAISDPTRTISKTLNKFNHENNHDLCIKHINSLINQHKDINLILIGNPVNIDNSPSKMSIIANNFKNKLISKIINKDIVIKMYDERYTTKIAKTSLHSQGYNKKTQIKELKDSESALIMVEEYINKN